MSEIDESVAQVKRFDPLRAASSEAPTFNRLWLTHGASMTPLQRVGFGIFSLAFVGIGLFTLAGAVSTFGAPELFLCFCYSMATVFFLYLGLRGLRKVFRRQ